MGFSSRTKADIGAGTHRASRRRCLRTANSSGLCWSVSGLTRSPGVQRPRPPDLRPGALRRLEASARRHVKRGGAGPQGRTQTRFARPPSGYRRSAGPPGERSGGLVRQRTRASPMGPRASRTDGHGGVAGAKRQKKRRQAGAETAFPQRRGERGQEGGRGGHRSLQLSIALRRPVLERDSPEEQIEVMSAAEGLALPPRTACGRAVEVWGSAEDARRAGMWRLGGEYAVKILH